MPMDSGTPDLVRHCVNAVAEQYDGDTSTAFAVCVAQLQKAGYLEKGSMQLTAAGKAKEQEHESEPDYDKKMASYEKLLKANRKEESADDTFSYKQDAEWDQSFYEKLANPAKLTGLENYPNVVARRWEVQNREESAMRFMKHLIGNDRYLDRVMSNEEEAPEEREGSLVVSASGWAESKKVSGKVLSEGAAVGKLLGESVFRKGDKVDIWDGEDLISTGTYVSASQPIAGVDVVKVQIEKNFIRQALNKVGSVGDYAADMLLPAKQGLKKKGVQEQTSVTARLRALLSEADEPEEHYFKNEDGGMFVLKKMGNKFMVATAGATADDDMADLYSRSVRKAASMSDAIKIIKKMVR